MPEWKVIGLLIGGTGTIVAAAAKLMDERSKACQQLASTSTTNVHRSRVSLYVSVVSLAIAVLGFAAGFAGELASQRAAADAAAKQAEIGRLQTEKNHQILEKLTRIFTRFEGISLNFGYSLSLKGDAMETFRNELVHNMDVLIDKNATAGMVENGVRVVNSSALRGPTLFWYEFTHEAGVFGLTGLDKQVTTGELYLLRSVPHIAIFKDEVDPTQFRNEYPSQYVPDLQLTLREGIGRMILSRPSNEFEQPGDLVSGGVEILSAEVPRHSWCPSGRIMSLKELEGATALIYVPWYITGATGMREVWNSTELSSIGIIINGLSFTIRANDLSLVETETSYGNTYVYRFGKMVETE